MKQHDWQAGIYEANARFICEFGIEILPWLDAKPGERILDLGCGDGYVTERIAQSGADVLGIDSSEDMLAAARARGLAVQHADILDLPFEAEFDAVFTNSVLHWVPDHARAASQIAKALKPGGRLVGDCGGHGNLAAIRTALRAVGQAHCGDPAVADPFVKPTPGEIRAVLERAGFTVQRAELVPRLTPLASGMWGWLETFRLPFFDQFQEPERSRVIEEAIALLRPILCDTAGNWVCDHVRLRVMATL